ncbi:hypothetical protein [Pseudomonas silesiensis]|uniref:hypothetical protein n=1 Tax=Pseudomonas silesiensis TaxID=1853130 RepID=UPI0013747C79|nr:hypothetical protein [Pseudomonas silesiensis]
MKRLNLHRATLPLFLCALKASASSGRFRGDVGVNATSVHKSEICCGFFLKTSLSQ